MEGAATLRYCRVAVTAGTNTGNVAVGWLSDPSIGPMDRFKPHLIPK